MKSTKNIEKSIRNPDLAIDTNTKMDRVILSELLEAQQKSKKTKSAAIEPNIWRIIMKSPIIKLGVAAVIIAAVTLRLFEFIDTGSSSGIVWAKVARKVQASRGHIVRGRETLHWVGMKKRDYAIDGDYTIRYSCPKHSRLDIYKNGRIITTFYSDLETMTHTSVFHTHKRYISEPLTESEGFLERNEDWMNPRYIVQRILSSEHRELGQKTIEGVLCEGLETTDPAVIGPLPALLRPVDRLMVHMRLWVDAETEYPVLFESTKALEAKGLAVVSAGVMDQFHWDVELDPNLFEPNIPQDYVSR